MSVVNCVIIYNRIMDIKLRGEKLPFGFFCCNYSKTMLRLKVYAKGGDELKKRVSPRMYRVIIAEKIKNLLEIKERSCDEESRLLALKKEYAQSLREENDFGKNNSTAIEKS